MLLTALALVFGKVVYTLGGATIALRYYDLCIRLWPQKRFLFVPEKAFVCERSNRTAAAIDYYSQALQLEPENSLLYFDLACVHEATGETARALEYYEKTLELGNDLSDQFLARLRERIHALKSRPH